MGSQGLANQVLIYVPQFSRIFLPCNCLLLTLSFPTENKMKILILFNEYKICHIGRNGWLFIQTVFRAIIPFFKREITFNIVLKIVRYLKKIA